MLMTEIALQLAAKGKYVFPCRPRGKEPLTSHGFKDATTDPEQIRRWWSEHPDANLGLATGLLSRLVVLDDRDLQLALERDAHADHRLRLSGICQAKNGFPAFLYCGSP